MTDFISPESVYELIDVDLYQSVQDELAKSCGLSLNTFLGNGQQICFPSNKNKICTEVINSYPNARSCKHFCGTNLSNIFSTGKTKFFKCFLHLTNFAIPYVLTNNFKFFVTGGNIFTSYSDFSKFLGLIENFGINTDDFLKRIKFPKIMEEIEFKKNLRLIEKTLAIVFKNIQKNELSTRQVRRLLTLFHSGITLKTSDSVKDIFPTISNVIINLFKTETVAILSPDSDGVFKTKNSLGPLREIFEHPHAKEFDRFLERSIHLREPVFINSPGIIETYGFAQPLDCLSLFPFTYGSEGKGVIAIAGKQPLDLLSQQILSLFCNQLSINFEGRKKSLDRITG